MTRGAFISIEGGDGAGKTTQLKHIEEYLVRENIEYVMTREPGGTALAEHLRALMLTPDRYAIDDTGTEVMLMMSARMHHLNRVIIPRLNEGVWVICDRFTDSTVAYQGYGSGYDIEKILHLADIVHADYWPDLTLYFNVSSEVSAQRRRNRSAMHEQGDSEATLDRFESEGESFQQRVQHGYQSLARLFPHRIEEIDASGDVKSVWREVRVAIQSLQQRLERG